MPGEEPFREREGRYDYRGPSVEDHLSNDTPSIFHAALVFPANHQNDESNLEQVFCGAVEAAQEEDCIGQEPQDKSGAAFRRIGDVGDGVDGAADDEEGAEDGGAGDAGVEGEDPEGGEEDDQLFEGVLLDAVQAFENLVAGGRGGGDIVFASGGADLE